MRIPPLHLHFLGLLGLLPRTLLASEPPDDSKKPPKPIDPECTVTSPHSENFFDLRKLQREHVPKKGPPQTDWIIKGLDYGANFSINICGPVIADASRVEGISEKEKDAVGAFYEKNGTMYSIGFVCSLLSPPPPRCVLANTLQIRLYVTTFPGSKASPHLRKWIPVSQRPRIQEVHTHVTDVRPRAVPQTVGVVRGPDERLFIFL
jgi:hypothetical protein